MQPFDGKGWITQKIFDKALTKVVRDMDYAILNAIPMHPLDAELPVRHIIMNCVSTPEYVAMLGWLHDERMEERLYLLNDEALAYFILLTKVFK